MRAISTFFIVTIWQQPTLWQIPALGTFKFFISFFLQSYSLIGKGNGLCSLLSWKTTLTTNIRCSSKATLPTADLFVESIVNAARCCQVALNWLAFKIILRHMPIKQTTVEFLCMSLTPRRWRIEGWKPLARVFNMCQKVFKFVLLTFYHPLFRGTMQNFHRLLVP